MLFSFSEARKISFESSQSRSRIVFSCSFLVSLLFIFPLPLRIWVASHSSTPTYSILSNSIRARAEVDDVHSCRKCTACPNVMSLSFIFSKVRSLSRKTSRIVYCHRLFHGSVTNTSKTPEGRSATFWGSGFKFFCPFSNDFFLFDFFLFTKSPMFYLRFFSFSFFLFFLHVFLFIFSFFFLKKKRFLTFGQVKKDARYGRSRHPLTNQPTNQSFRVCEVNLATLKLATTLHVLTELLRFFHKTANDSSFLLIGDTDLRSASWKCPPAPDLLLTNCWRVFGESHPLFLKCVIDAWHVKLSCRCSRCSPWCTLRPQTCVRPFSVPGVFKSRQQSSSSPNEPEMKDPTQWCLLVPQLVHSPLSTIMLNSIHSMHQSQFCILRLVLELCKLHPSAWPPTLQLQTFLSFLTSLGFFGHRLRMKFCLTNLCTEFFNFRSPKCFCQHVSRIWFRCHFSQLASVLLLRSCGYSILVCVWRVLLPAPLREETAFALESVCSESCSLRFQSANKLCRPNPEHPLSVTT